MLIPSIDLMGGKVVQLVQGSKKALEFDDPQEWIDRFRKYPLVQLIDLDAALGRGHNRDLVRAIAGQLPCQVGGGIRTIEAAEETLGTGARKIILGSSLISNGAINLSAAANALNGAVSLAKTGANDNGAQEIDVLNYWRQTGIAGHKIQAYVALEPSNTTHIMDGTWIFGGCYIGLALPKTAQAQTQNHQPWSATAAGTTGDGAPGSWGGHAVPVVAYDSRSVTVVTWGALQTMTWGFWAAYCDEAYAILSPDFLKKKDGKPATPDGFNVQQLLEDLADLK